MARRRQGQAGARRHPAPRARNRWSTFARRYGWRAYALPILTVITVAALVQGVPSSGTGHTVAGQNAAGHDAAGHDAARHHAPGSTPTAGRPAAAKGVQVEGLTSQDAGFDAGTTPEPVVIRLGNDAASCATNTFHQLVLVSISKQHLWACDGNRQVDSTAVTTGKSIDHDQTPLGSWRVQAKQRNRYLVGPGYRDYVKYWVPFNGDFGLHDASWQTMPFGSKDYRQHGSHGCVHLPTPTMRWLYRWAGVGDTVVTVVS